MENKIKMARPKRKAIFISVICTVVGIPLILIPIITIIVYESIFGARYETAPYLEFKVEDFEGSDMAYRTIKEAAQSVGASIETPVQREDDEWDICTMTTKLNLGL
jgi:hypothetical protein